MAKTQQERAYEFQVSLEQHSLELRARVAEAYLHIVLLVFMSIVVGSDFSPGTPVDHGFARNSWVVGFNSIAPFRQDPEPANGDRKAPVALVSADEGQTAILSVKLSDEVHLTSNCAYMGPLEDGWSQQAPTGMVWLAIHAAQQMVDRVVAEMLS